MHVASSINPNGDYEVIPHPNESVSQIAWHPSSQYLVASAWDNTVRCWKVNRLEGCFGTEAKAYISHDAPVLSTCFNHDGTTVFSGGCDNVVLSWDLITNQSVVATEHSAPVKFVHWLADKNLLMTGSWDQTVKFLDPRASAPASIIKLKEKVYCADVKDNIGVVGCSDKEIYIFDFKYSFDPVQNFKSPLKLQSRSVSVFVDKKGFALGSVEGRVTISHIDAADLHQNFAFKCMFLFFFSIFLLSFLKFLRSSRRIKYLCNKWN